MYKTIWLITDIMEDTSTELTLYHFGKEPKFPTWYMEENKVYEIEMLWNFKLLLTPKIFFKCLTHFYKIK
jgi:hypothetical protein